MPRVIVTTDGKGGVKVEGNGFTGASCKDATAALEKLLGRVKDVDLKPEYDKQNETGHAVGVPAGQ